MQPNGRLNRILASRQLGGGVSAVACPGAEAGSTLTDDLRLFALTFAAGFLFTSIFIA